MATLLVFAFTRPWLGLLIWSWLAYMNVHRLAYGFAYLFPFSMITAVVIFISLFLSGERIKFPITRETILLFCLCVWMTVTSFVALDPVFVWEFWGRSMKIEVMVFVTMMVMRERWKLNALIWTIVLSLGFFGVKGAIFTLVTGGQHRVHGPENSFIENNNQLALALVMTLPLMRYLQMNSRRPWVRLMLTGLMVLSTLSILATYSRGGMVSLVALLLIMWLKSRRKLALALATVMILAPLIAFMPHAWVERMHSTKDYEDDSSAQGRFNAWKFAINVAKERPLTGGGFHTFTWMQFLVYAPDPRDVHDAHSNYFQMLAEHGFVGLGLFLSLWACTWLSGSWVIRHGRATPGLEWAADMSEMVQVSLFAYLTGGLFSGLAYYDFPYHLMAITVISKDLIRDEMRVIDAARWSPVAVPAAAAPNLEGQVLT